MTPLQELAARLDAERYSGPVRGRNSMAVGERLAGLVGLLAEVLPDDERHVVVPLRRGRRAS